MGCVATPATPGPQPPPTPTYGRRYVLDRQAGEWLIWDRRKPATPTFRAPDTPEGWRAADKRFRRLEPSPGARAGITTGIVLVSIWMAISLIYSWLFLGFGSIYVCQSDAACLDRYNLWWGLLLLLHPIAILTAILLIVFPRTRLWGLVVGFLGTGVAAIVFTAAFRVPL